MDSFVFKLKIFKFGLKAVLGLLSAGNLLVEGFNGFLCLSKASRQLVLAALKLFNSAQTFSLILRSPELHLSLCLGQGLESIRLLLILFFNAFLQVLKLSVHVLELAEQGSPVSSFTITHSLGVFQLSGQGNL